MILFDGSLSSSLPDKKKSSSLLLEALLFYLNLEKADSNALKPFFKQEKAETSSVIRTVFLQLTLLKKPKQTKETKNLFQGIYSFI